jgi:hypothetical protein
MFYQFFEKQTTLARTLSLVFPKVNPWLVMVWGTAKLSCIMHEHYAVTALLFSHLLTHHSYDIVLARIKSPCHGCFITVRGRMSALTVKSVLQLECQVLDH